MSESTERLTSDLIEKLKNIFGSVISPKDRPKVEKFIHLYKLNKEHKYLIESKQPKGLGTIIRRSLESVAEVNPDSKIELYMHNVLQEERLQFSFQYKIGPFRADFLIAETLVLEIDGPMHNEDYDKRRDKYLKKMGYDVMRVPTWLIEMDTDLIIKEIRERCRGINQSNL